MTVSEPGTAGDVVVVVVVGGASVVEVVVEVAVIVEVVVVVVVGVLVGPAVAGPTMGTAKAAIVATVAPATPSGLNRITTDPPGASPAPQYAPSERSSKDHSGRLVRRSESERAGKTW